MPEILTDAYLLFTFVFKQALSLNERAVWHNRRNVYDRSR